MHNATLQTINELYQEAQLSIADAKCIGDADTANKVIELLTDVDDIEIPHRRGEQIAAAINFVLDKCSVIITPKIAMRLGAVIRSFYALGYKDGVVDWTYPEIKFGGKNDKSD